VVNQAGPYRVVLTEEGYTTADQYPDKVSALAEFARFAPLAGTWSRGGSVRVMGEAEYQRLKPELDRRNDVDE